MTLEKRIENVLLKYEIAREESKVKMIEVIAEEFAIGFGQWLLNQPYRVKYNDKKELLEIYKETL